MKLKVMKMYEDVELPSYATDGSACLDIKMFEPDTEYTSDDNSLVIGTGLKFEIPSGFTMLVYSRSGHGFKNNTRLANCVGVIDSDYRGELKIKLTRDSIAGGDLHFSNGDRIAQAMIIPIPKIELEEVTELSSTMRGEGGFGSTG